MDLLAYIADMGRRQRLAADVQSHPDYLWQIATGRRKASHVLARAIETATAGQVTRYDLRPDVFGEAPVAHKAA